ncbi:MULTISPECIES: hypothetical protein [Streptosporangium]|uniref:Amidohydrolase-related domain-containing protein n=1 Tax=Streptosporangium brasiliense TaxID=47480 RepID=A0ABT9R6H9_9ACTN|nr:hypothetical protein [Streptosporangium brasiliense]MDP9864471.1 hypothetical protein [Streptosporangium brasiliense]
MCTPDLPLSRYRPVSQLRVPVHHVDRARLPAVDAHIHLGRWLTEDGDWMVKDVPALLETMDALNLRGMVNLDGRWGRELAENIERYDAAHPGKFATFCHVDWSQAAEPGFGERLAARRGVRPLPGRPAADGPLDHQRARPPRRRAGAGLHRQRAQARTEAGMNVWPGQRQGLYGWFFRE